MFLWKLRFWEKKFPSQVLAPKMIRDKWTVTEDVSPSRFKIGNLRFVNYLPEKKKYIFGEEMRERAVLLGANLGLCDAKRVLERQSELPACLRRYRLFFPATLLRDAMGRPRVPYLWWSGQSWKCDFDYVDLVWEDPNDRLVGT